ncbi:HTH domain-containing protein [Snuella lapsa]
MTYTERKEKEKYLLYLIKQNRLGSIEEVAENFECSIRTVERMLRELREEGHKIAFCRKTNKYFLKNS